MGNFYSGKNVVISGGTKGIGREIALALAAQGANLFIIARDSSVLKSFVKEVSGRFPQISVHGFAADVGEYSQVKKAAREISKKFGSIDGLVSNAGVAIPRYFTETPVGEFELINQVKYLGTVYLVKELYPFFNDNSFISFTSSVAGYLGVFGYSSYTGPNFALIGFAEVLTQELASRNISVSVLCPPDTETPGYEIEEKTKPMETKKISGNVKLMAAENVARIFLKKLEKRKMIITVNFDSALMYFLKRMMPSLMIKIMVRMIQGFQKGK